jgi:hypothetical protein
MRTMKSPPPKSSGDDSGEKDGSVMWDVPR